MKYIRKDKEPDSLTQHRLTPHSDYDNYKEKDDLVRHCSKNKDISAVIVCRG